MLEIILVGILGAVGIAMVVHTVEESLRAFERDAARRSSGPDLDDEPQWRRVRPAQEDRTQDEEREAA